MRQFTNTCELAFTLHLLVVNFDRKCDRKGPKMAIQISSEKLALCDAVQVSYFVKNKSRKPTRVGHARLIDISEAGLCMEISPLDSDLFMESQGKLFVINSDVEVQLFCRTHPTNLFVAGCIKWFKRKKEAGDTKDDGNIYVGVIFPANDRNQKRDIVELMRHLKKETTKCTHCDAIVSAAAAICYSCGSKPARKRTIFKKMIFSFLAATNGDQK